VLWISLQGLLKDLLEVVVVVVEEEEEEEEEEQDVTRILEFGPESHRGGERTRRLRSYRLVKALEVELGATVAVVVQRSMMTGERIDLAVCA
jgi:predicted DNA-binding ArsR family transcriptional regulator